MKNFSLALICLVAAFCATKSLHAQGTAFTYQGRLDTNGVPVGGNYDFKFSIFGTNTGGSVAAGPVTNAAVTVSNGLFTTILDFGTAPSGNPAWLDIAVRTNGSGGFTTLSPRQQLLPTPYAMFANTASNLLGTASNLVVNGTFHVNGATNDIPIAAENLRIVRGYVAYDGTIESGSGFTVVTNSPPGFYTITFNPGFGDKPAVTGMGGDAMTFFIIANNQVQIETETLGGSPPALGPARETFSFIAIGSQ